MLMMIILKGKKKIGKQREMSKIMKIIINDDKNAIKKD